MRAALIWVQPIVTRLTNADQVVIVKRQLGIILQLLDVMYRNSRAPLTKPLADLTPIAVASQDYSAFMLPCF